MNLIERASRCLEIPNDRVTIASTLGLPDTFKGAISLGTNNVPDAPHIAIELHLANKRAQYTIIFIEDPPLEPLVAIGCVVDTNPDYQRHIQDIPKRCVRLLDIGWDALMHPDSTDIREKEGIHALIGLMANLAYTPLAKLEISRTRQWVDINLTIGEWEAHRQVKYTKLKKHLKL